MFARKRASVMWEMCVSACHRTWCIIIVRVLCFLLLLLEERAGRFLFLKGGWWDQVAHSDTQGKSVAGLELLCPSKEKDLARICGFFWLFPSARSSNYYNLFSKPLCSSAWPGKGPILHVLFLFLGCPPSITSSLPQINVLTHRWVTTGFVFLVHKNLETLFSMGPRIFSNSHPTRNSLFPSQIIDLFLLLDFCLSLYGLHLG